MEYTDNALWINDRPHFEECENQDPEYLCICPELLEELEEKQNDIESIGMLEGVKL